jgi:hypothetical protein
MIASNTRRFQGILIGEKYRPIARFRDANGIAPVRRTF